MKKPFKIPLALVQLVAQQLVQQSAINLVKEVVKTGQQGLGLLQDFCWEMRSKVR